MNGISALPRADTRQAIPCEPRCGLTTPTCWHQGPDFPPPDCEKEQLMFLSAGSLLTRLGAEERRQGTSCCCGQQGTEWGAPARLREVAGLALSEGPSLLCDLPEEALEGAGPVTGDDPGAPGRACPLIRTVGQMWPVVQVCALSRVISWMGGSFCPGGSWPATRPGAQAPRPKAME